MCGVLGVCWSDCCEYLIVIKFVHVRDACCFLGTCTWELSAILPFAALLLLLPVVVLLVLLGWSTAAVICWCNAKNHRHASSAGDVHLEPAAFVVC
jgi:hypothetical protein